MSDYYRPLQPYQHRRSPKGRRDAINRAVFGLVVFLLLALLFAVLR